MGEAAEVPADYAPLLEIISNSYHHFDKDRKMLNHAMKLISEEMIDLNSNLRKETLDIIDLNASLEQKVKERTAMLESTNKELEAFGYSLSHDLRAPLRVINGFGKMLLKKSANKLDQEEKETLEVIMSNAAHMGQLIDDLLAFSRMGRAVVSKNPVDMKSIVHVAIEEVRALQENTKATIRLHDLGHANADPTHIKQVWLNLVSNALKYSRKKETPLIEIGTMGEKGSLAYFVRDNGVGFDMEHYGKLFAVFQRLHKVTEYEGTGVGLALVQRIITKHGGKIWAEGKINEGATFYFTLPK